jgi:hypothetical protein
VLGVRFDAMRSELRIPVLALAVVGLALVALGAVYLSVECQSLPSFLGPSRGDTSPRTGLGALATALGLITLAGAALAARRRG